MATDVIIKIKALGSRFQRDESAATAIEYGLLMGILGVMLLVSLSITGDRIVAVFDFILSNYDQELTSSSSSSGN